MLTLHTHEIRMTPLSHFSIYSYTKYIFFSHSVFEASIDELVDRLTTLRLSGASHITMFTSWNLKRVMSCIHTQYTHAVHTADYEVKAQLDTDFGEYVYKIEQLHYSAAVSLYFTTFVIHISFTF